MGRTGTRLSVLLVGAILVVSTGAQGPPGQRHGPGGGDDHRPGLGRGGHGLGRGAGMGHRRGIGGHAGGSARNEGPYQVTFPVIAHHGGVVPLPGAAQQPRAWTKLLVDLTSGGDPDKLNSGLEKVAKFLNIYAGGGAEPADVKIAVVLHGDATLAVLAAEAYAAKFKTDGNPNLELMQQLHQSGVELFVCGQSLIAKGSNPDQVAEFVSTAVSALTAVVNLQADGFAYVPLGHAAPSPSRKPHTITAEGGGQSDHTDHVPGHSAGHGRGRGPGAMRGMRGDMTTLHAMFADRDKIKRTVKMLPDGAEAVTESDDETVADRLKEHVPAMEDRVLGDQPLPPMTIHPIFVELIKHANDYTLTYEETEKGMKVKYQADDPYVVMLVQEHAKLVSRFIKNGRQEIHAPYAFPEFPKEAHPNGRQE